MHNLYMCGQSIRNSYQHNDSPTVPHTNQYGATHKATAIRRNAPTLLFYHFADSGCGWSDKKGLELIVSLFYLNGICVTMK